MDNYITYQEQEVKIKKALFAGKIEPTSNTECWTSTLLDNSSDWAYLKTGYRREWALERVAHLQYKPEQLIALEEHFLEVWEDEGANNKSSIAIATYSTLKLLKKIHIDNGEVIPAPVKIVRSEMSLIS